MIRQDSILELLLRAGSSSGPRLSRSVSKDSGIDAGGEVVLLQKQVQLLQDEVTRLRLRGEEPAAEKAEPGSKKLTNGETGDVTKGKKVRNRSTNVTPRPPDQLKRARLPHTSQTPDAGVGTSWEPPPPERHSRRSHLKASDLHPGMST